MNTFSFFMYKSRACLLIDLLKTLCVIIHGYIVTTWRWLCPCKKYTSPTSVCSAILPHICFDLEHWAQVSSRPWPPLQRDCWFLLVCYGYHHRGWWWQNRARRGMRPSTLLRTLYIESCHGGGVWWGDASFIKLLTVSIFKILKYSTVEYCTDAH